MTPNQGFLVHKTAQNVSNISLLIKKVPISQQSKKSIIVQSDCKKNFFKKTPTIVKKKI